jgi:hypothetical protein
MVATCVSFSFTEARSAGREVSAVVVVGAPPPPALDGMVVPLKPAAPGTVVVVSAAPGTVVVSPTDVEVVVFLGLLAAA